MKFLQNSLRVVIAGGSLAGFLTGWVLLAHAGKPAPDNPPSLPAIEMPSLPSVGPAPSVQPLQPLPSLPRTQSAMPRLRTRGS